MEYKVSDIVKALKSRNEEIDEETGQIIIKKALQKSGKYSDNLKYNFFGDLKSVDGELSEIVNDVKVYLENEANRVKAAKEEKEVAEKKQREHDAEAAKILVTSGYNFEGYNIVKYSGYISGDDCITMPRNNFWGNKEVPNYLCGSLVKIRRQALKELKESALDLGCNAVIGVDFDYLVMDPQHSAPLNNQGTIYEPYVICVTANGTAVKIVKDGYEDEEEILDSEVVSDIAEELPEL